MPQSAGIKRSGAGVYEGPEGSLWMLARGKQTIVCTRQKETRQRKKKCRFADLIGELNC